MFIIDVTNFKMSEEVLINRFCKLNLNKLSEEQFKTDANSLLDELLSFAHWTGGEKSGKDLCEQVWLI